MPYAALLSRETRSALGVRLEGAVVVVDEAHNVVEAINSVHSKKVTLSEVRTCRNQSTARDRDGCRCLLHPVFSAAVGWWWCVGALL